MPTAPAQRLRCHRGSVHLSAELATVETQRMADIINLSGSGCLLHTEETMRPGDVVTLRFSLPGMKEVEAVGRVARVGNRTAVRQSLGLSSSLTTPAPRAQEEGFEFETGDRFFVGIAFDHIEERDTEMIVRHVFREAQGRRRIA